MNHIAAVALEWWRGMGPRTPERLRELVDQGARLWGITDTHHINTLYQEAWGSIPKWEKEKHQ